MWQAFRSVPSTGTLARTSILSLSSNGDGRCDSPGYCAKYGSYTLIEEEMNRVVDFELVQVGVETPLPPPPSNTHTHTHHHHHHHPTFTVISVSVSLPFSVQFCFFSRAMRSGIVPGWSTKDW